MFKPKRVPNYKIDWVLKNKILALTHFHSEITKDDISGVIKELTGVLENVNNKFDMIIDNRLAPMNQLNTLDELQRSSPMMSHSYLNHLVLIKPLHVSFSKKDLEIQTNRNVKLKNVASVCAAIVFLKISTKYEPQDKIDMFFFPTLPKTND